MHVGALAGNGDGGGAGSPGGICVAGRDGGGRALRVVGSDHGGGAAAEASAGEPGAEDAGGGGQRDVDKGLARVR